MRFAHKLMALVGVLPIFCCTSCTSKYKPKELYEIAKGEKIEFEVSVFRNEPYYWEWQNEEKSTCVELSSRVYANTIFSSENYLRGVEHWVLEGQKAGTDTVKIYLRTYEEDSLNVAIADSVIMVVKVR